ncbi:MAG: hypothetical protein JOY90_04825 [Bradyrhizobium sp.]|uniref:hypothetical protein n=1 Tax=Bradyrhizobium sp. TaxID=376 RepID=UPI001D93AD0F|nr:hypothetical protein [Bradyrhizobium sp.]MBV9559775.1 hypothetical protein [Bradyrhizobium sp.]
MPGSTYGSDERECVEVMIATGHDSRAMLETDDGWSYLERRLSGNASGAAR